MPVQVGRVRLTQIVARRQFQHALKGPVINFHHEKTALRRAAAVRPVSTDAESVALDGNLEVVAAHPGQLDFNDQSIVGGVNICIWDPMCPGGSLSTSGAGHKMHCRTDFAHGHSSGKITLSGFYKQARSFGFNYDLRTLTLARAKYDGVLRRVTPRGRTAAVRIALKTELTWAKPTPQQQCRCGADYRQRNQLLPIHVRKII